MVCARIAGAGYAGAMTMPLEHRLSFTIRRYADVAGAPGLRAALDAIFFEASNTKSFASEEARVVFRERWLGKYLTHDPDWAYVAQRTDGHIAGYLAGSLSDPALTPRFSEIPYFAAFKDLTRRYPAHLHVNLAGGQRSQGIGSALVERFVRDASDAGAPGVHVVTSRGARNVGFYARNSFLEVGAHGEGAREIVFLGREIRAREI